MGAGYAEAGLGPERGTAQRQRGGDPEALRRQARERLKAALRERGDRRWLRVVTLPAPTAAPDALLSGAGELAGLAQDGLHGVLWQPPGGPSRCGVGVAWEAALAGGQRMEQLRAQLELLPSRLQLDEQAQHMAPRIFGGLAFVPGWRARGEDAAPWGAFGDGRFFLPRWCHGQEGDEAFLQVALRGDGARGEEALAELEVAFDALCGRRPPGPEEGPRQLVEQIDQTPLPLWTAQVRDILEAIGRGEFAKIVAARRCVVTMRHPIDEGALRRRLAQEQPGCTVFALRCGGAAFLGATPERLIARAGLEVRTEALAGTRARAGEEAELGRSRKDLAEHQLVVADLLARLGPFCASTPLAGSPVLRRLRDLLHLHTPISARLRGATHVLDLVSALHPTPAVAGTPFGEAARWIAQREPDPRGWYAGPVGWFDARGDGEFVVALRSALVQGRRAHLYAGAGIVSGSDPDREYDETALKQRALLSALGASP